MLVTNLPNEVLAEVFRNLESLEDLGHAILTCRSFFNTFRLNKDIPSTILAASWDPELLPLAVATELVAELPHPRSGRVVRELVDSLVYDPENLFKKLKTLEMKSLLSMVQTHGAVLDLAFDMAEDAFKQFDFSEYTFAYEKMDAGLSPAEATRFCRAMYRTQLYLLAFVPAGRRWHSVMNGQIWLLESFASFEIEQIACVYDYLERLTHRITRFTVANDYHFGHQQYDWLSLGDNLNMSRFICQGVVWLAGLVNLDPDQPVQVLRDELRRVAPERIDEPDYADLWSALSGLRSDVQNDEQGEVQFTVKDPRDSSDPDSGPPSAYDYVHLELVNSELDPAEVNIMSLPQMDEEDYGLRERAYVLWDMGRMKDQDMFYQMDLAPEESSLYIGREWIWQHNAIELWWESCDMDWAAFSDTPKFPILNDAINNGWEQVLIGDNLMAGESVKNPKKWRFLSPHLEELNPPRSSSRDWSDIEYCYFVGP